MPLTGTHLEDGTIATGQRPLRARRLSEATRHAGSTFRGLAAVAAVLAALVRPACSQPAARPDSPATQPGDAAGIVVDEKARSVALPAKVAKQGTYAELAGMIEYVLVTTGGKAYESLFVTEAPVPKIHEAMSRIGLRAGRPASEDSPPRGLPVQLFVVYERDGKEVRRPIDELVLHAATRKPLAPVGWLFTGSSQATDPATGATVSGASVTGSIIGLHYGDSSPLLQNPRAECRRENIYKANLEQLPPAGTAVRIILQRPPAKGTGRRVHVLVSGRLAAAGYGEFVEGQARQLKLTGFVRSLPDERVEVLAEGPTDAVGQFLDKIKTGPRAARVEKFEANDEPPQGDLEAFENWN